MRMVWQMRMTLFPLYIVWARLDRRSDQAQTDGQGKESFLGSRSEDRCSGCVQPGSRKTFPMKGFLDRQVQYWASGSIQIDMEPECQYCTLGPRISELAGAAIIFGPLLVCGPKIWLKPAAHWSFHGHFPVSIDQGNAVGQTRKTWPTVHFPVNVDLGNDLYTDLRLTDVCEAWPAVSWSV